MTSVRRGVGIGTAVAVLAFGTIRMTADQTTESVHLVVTGGDFAGSYDVTSTAGGCSTGINGPGSWGNSLIIKGATDPKALVGLPLIVPNAKAAAAGTREFYLAVGFGPVLKRAKLYQLEIEGRADKKPTGIGSVTVTDNGASAVVTFVGKTADGTALQGKITCNIVVRMVP
jgi:hypothetical protein